MCIRDRVLIAPEPGTLESASAEFDSPRGRIVVRWNQEGETFHLAATVPVGVEAIALMPDGSKKSLSIGENILSSTVHQR